MTVVKQLRAPTVEPLDDAAAIEVSDLRMR